MKRLTKRELIELKDGQKDVACNYKDDECNDNCMHGYCKWNKGALKKLKTYEDAEEQGLLVKLPCKIGADVYTIPSKVNFELNVLSGRKDNNRVYHQKIANITFTEKGWYMTGHLDMEYGTGRTFIDMFYKKTWFLTKEEAEKALERMEAE